MSPRARLERKRRRVHLTRVVRRGFQDARELVAAAAYEVTDAGQIYLVDPFQRRAWLVLGVRKSQGVVSARVSSVSSPRVVRRLCRGLPRAR